MTSVVGKFSHIKSYDGNDVIHIGNRNSLSISHIGDACVLTNERKLDLKDVLVVPNLKKKNCYLLEILLWIIYVLLNSSHLALLLRIKIKR